MKHDESTSGQSLLEFAMILPLVLGLSLGVVEVGYALLDQHVVTKLAREGSNLISRNTTMAAAGDVMLSMSTRPVNFNPGGGSKLILSVLKMGAAGTANACCPGVQTAEPCKGWVSVRRWSSNPSCYRYRMVPRIRRVRGSKDRTHQRGRP